MFLAVLLVTFGPTTGPDTFGKPICRNPEVLTARKDTTGGGIHPLGGEPPARHIRAVLRTDFDGCVKPVTIKARVGKR